MSVFSSLEDFGISKKRAVISAAVAILLAAGVVGILGKLADFHKAISAFAEANLWWFFGCLIGEIIAYQGYILAYRDIARASSGPRLNWWDAMRIIGIGLGAVIFGATAASLAVDFWALRRAGARVHESARRVLALNTMEWAVLAALAVAAGIFLLAKPSRQVASYIPLLWVIVVPLCYGAAYWFTDYKRVKKYATLPQQSNPKLHWEPGSWAPWAWLNIRKGFADSIGGVALLRHIIANPRSYQAGNGGFAIYWLGHMCCLYSSIQAFHYKIGLAALVLAYATTYLLSILPLPVGGAGGIEAALVYMLHAIGMPLHLALVSTLAFRTFTFWLPIIPALIFLPMVKKLEGDLKAVKRDNSTPKMRQAAVLLDVD